MRNVVDIIKNTQFNNSTISNDFAILKLDFSLDFNDENIRPVRLPTTATDIPLDFTNDRCFASGWGTLQSGKFS